MKCSKNEKKNNNKRMSHRDRLVRFYEKYNPAKVGSVDMALEAYAGREEEMFEALVGKYGPEPAAAVAPDPPDPPPPHLPLRMV